MPEILAPGQGNLLLRFDVDTNFLDDDSADPSTQSFYTLPDTTASPRVTRTFKFDRLNGQWSINGQVMDCNDIRSALPRAARGPNCVVHGYFAGEVPCVSALGTAI